jgi:hypothetical protein
MREAGFFFAGVMVLALGALGGEGRVFGCEGRVAREEWGGLGGVGEGGLIGRLGGWLMGGQGD